MTEDDYDEEMERRLRYVITMHLEAAAKNRFINKQTANTQRLRLINRMFPGAYYIHMIRDPRAVINSFLNVDFWNDMNVWWLGGKTVSELRKQGGKPIELAMEHWRRNLQEIMSNKDILDKYMEVGYEDFVKDPRLEVGRILTFCGLSFPERFKEFVPENLPNRNYKWHEDLNKEQISSIEKNINDGLKSFHMNDLSREEFQDQTGQTVA
jgi:hypothetical protein